MENTDITLIQILQELLEMNEELESPDIAKAITLLEKVEEEEGE